MGMQDFYNCKQTQFTFGKLRPSNSGKAISLWYYYYYSTILYTFHYLTKNDGERCMIDYIYVTWSLCCDSLFLLFLFTVKFNDSNKPTLSFDSDFCDASRFGSPVQKMYAVTRLVIHVSNHFMLHSSTSGRSACN